MATREIIALNEDVPQLEAPQAGDVYLAPRTVVHSDDVVTPNTSGKGMKLGDATTNAFGWKDITGQIEKRGGGADPAWTIVNAGPFYAYLFAVNDECWITYHVPHDYAPGTDIHLHVHWKSSGTDVNTVKWQFTYSITKGHQQSQFNTVGTVINAEQAGDGTAWTNMIAETVAITSSELEPDALICVHLKRVTNGATENADSIFVDTADVHYQSTNVATKNKSPDFYT